jgi:hypothetical protein
MTKDEIAYIKADDMFTANKTDISYFSSIYCIYTHFNRLHC